MMAHLHINQHYIIDDWAIAADELQWVLQKKHSNGRWKNLSFVRSNRDILERCMREKGTPKECSLFLLSSLPCSFSEWKATYPALSKNNSHSRLKTPSKGHVNAI